MIELAKHIEVLLLENDCVIVPGLGGFIAHNRQAEFKESENRFCSPARTIGFNPQLVMNDGLLVQTYMQAYNTDFPDATRKIEKIVSALKEQLYQKGEVCLPQIGTLYYTMNGTYVFEPSADKFFAPYLYGLDSLTLSPLQMVAGAQEERKIHPFTPKPSPEARQFIPETNVAYKRTFQRMAQHAVGIAAAVLLFFMLSVPVENTYMDDASYASLSAESMFDAIRGRSAATQLLGVKDSSQANSQQKTFRTISNVNTLKPIRVKSMTVGPMPKDDVLKKDERTTKVSKDTTSTNKTDNAKAEEVIVNTGSTKTDAVDKKPVAQSKDDPVKKIAETNNKTDKVEKTTANQTAIKATKNAHYIIVASLATAADAEKQVNAFKRQGFATASILEADNRYRISLCQFDKRADAEKKLIEIRKQKDFKHAWLFSAK